MGKIHQSRGSFAGGIVSLQFDINRKYSTFVSILDTIRLNSLKWLHRITLDKRWRQKLCLNRIQCHFYALISLDNPAFIYKFPFHSYSYITTEILKSTET